MSLIGLNSEHTFAAEVVLAYNRVLGRNPDRWGFEALLDMRKAGASFTEILQLLAASSEARAIVGRPALDLAWAAEDRPRIAEQNFAVMQIELTNRCPFLCIMCPRTDHMTRPLGAMTQQVFRKIIDELAAQHPAYAARHEPVWLHHFGESLVHPDFADFITYAR